MSINSFKKLKRGELKYIAGSRTLYSIFNVSLY